MAERRLPRSICRYWGKHSLPGHSGAPAFWPTSLASFPRAPVAAGFEVLNGVVLNQALVSIGSPERTRAVVRALQEDGTCRCCGTDW